MLCFLCVFRSVNILLIAKMLTGDNNFNDMKAQIDI